MNLFKKKQKQFVAVSFEEGLVKIAYVVLHKGYFTINKTHTLKYPDFDGFLNTTKEQDFIVVSTFRTFYQGVLSFPPAQEKYLQKLAEIELRKNYTEVKRFSFLYYVLGEIQHEGRKVKDTFVFAVDYEEIQGIIERFGRFNKTIIALYPSVLTLAALFSSTDNSTDENPLCILDTGSNKTLFFLKNSKVCFVRITQSDQPGINEPDIDNINMSINYCRQTLRLSPSKVVFINTTGHRHGSLSGIIVPSMDIEYPTQVVDHTESMAEHIVPLSAVLAHRSIRQCSLLPPVYQSLKAQKTVFVWSTAFLLLFSLIGIVKIVSTIFELPDLKTKIYNLRKEITEKEPVLNEYLRVNNELQKNIPLITYMNKANTSPDVQKVLAAFSFLPMKNIKVNSIQINVQNDILTIRLQGFVMANSFIDMDSHYRQLINTLKSNKSMNITTHSIDVKEMAFSVEAKWTT